MKNTHGYPFSTLLYHLVPKITFPEDDKPHWMKLTIYSVVVRHKLTAAVTENDYFQNKIPKQSFVFICKQQEAFFYKHVKTNKCIIICNQSYWQIKPDFNCVDPFWITFP